jgi:hypothetical protein
MLVCQTGVQRQLHDGPRCSAASGALAAAAASSAGLAADRPTFIERIIRSMVTRFCPLRRVRILWTAGESPTTDTVDTGPIPEIDWTTNNFATAEDRALRVASVGSQSGDLASSQYIMLLFCAIFSAQRAHPVEIAVNTQRLTPREHNRGCRELIVAEEGEITHRFILTRLSS